MGALSVLVLEDFGVCNERGDETHAVVCLQLFVCIDRNMICFSFSMPAFFYRPPSILNIGGSVVWME